MSKQPRGVSRRELAAAVGLAIPAAAAAQQSAAPATDLDAAARDQIKRNTDQLRKFKVPIATEPSFSFRP
jgi:hypothetical protein